MDTNEVLEAIVEVAETVVRPRFRHLDTDQVEEKHRGDYVTIADREAEAALTRRLAAAFPGALIVGEEAVFMNPSLVGGVASAGHVFTVDPVDGTKNFVLGKPDYGLMVGELHAGTPTRGWIYLPEYERAYVVERGAGVTCDGARVQRAPCPLKPRGASSRSGVVGLSSELLAEPIRRTWSSCAVDYPKLVAGEVDFIVFHSSNPWDHVPGVAMTREIGGVVTDPSGRDYTADLMRTALIAAASPASHAVAMTVAGSRIAGGRGRRVG